MKGKASAGLRDRTNQRLWRKLRKKTGCVMPEVKNQRETNSWYQLWYITAVAATAGCLVRVVFQMSQLLTAAVFISVFVYLQWMVKMKKQQQIQEVRLQDVSVYMDTVLYAFMKYGKISEALSDAGRALTEGKMKETIRRAFEHMQYTFDNTELLADSLGMIEAEYQTGRIHNIHEFMLHVEDYGGDFRRPAQLLLNEKQMWEKRIRKAIEERKRMFRDVVLSVAASIGICIIVQHIPAMNLDISKNRWIQTGTFLLILADEVILMRAQRYLAADWLQYDKFREEEQYEKKMIEFRNYDEGRSRRISFFLGMLMAVISAGLFWKGWNGPAIAGMLVMLLFFAQHRAGHYLAKKRLTEEIRRAFPNWLMDLVLLLQSENVQVALQKSVRNAPGVLRLELRELIGRLQLSPEDAAPYHSFLQEFEIPEIQSAMSMLYALSAGHGGNSDRQLGELISRNQDMLDEAEEHKNSDRNAGLYLLFLAPVLTASAKMLLDMSVFMLAFLRTTVG